MAFFSCIAAIDLGVTKLELAPEFSQLPTTPQ
jgi:hypothetical protein